MGGGNYNLIRLANYAYYKTITTISDLNGSITPGYTSWNGLGPYHVIVAGYGMNGYYRLSCQNNTDSKTVYYENRLFNSNISQNKDFVDDDANTQTRLVFRPIIEFKE